MDPPLCQQHPSVVSSHLTLKCLRMRAKALLGTIFYQTSPPSSLLSLPSAFLLPLLSSLLLPPYSRCPSHGVLVSSLA